MLRSNMQLATVRRDALLNALVGSYLIPTPLRWRLLRCAGLDVHRSIVASRCFFGGRNISIGTGTFVNYGCFFDTSERVNIGERCLIGMEAMFCTSTHEIGAAEQRAGTGCARPIYVGDGCWIGARAVILPGVTVGDGCVIGAGSVVVHDCEPHGTYVGVPARRVADLPRSTR